MRRILVRWGGGRTTRSPDRRDGPPRSEAQQARLSSVGSSPSGVVVEGAVGVAGGARLQRRVRRARPYGSGLGRRELLDARLYKGELDRVVLGHAQALGVAPGLLPPGDHGVDGPRRLVSAHAR